MIYRYFYVGYANGDKIKINQYSDYRNIAVFSFDSQLYLYFESDCPQVEPEQLVCDGVSVLPDGKMWLRAMNIFYYSKPLNPVQWKRKHLIRKPSLQIAQLFPDMVSSYIFYHFQLQEERPKLTGNKFNSIYIHENRIFMYGEMPNESDTSVYPGRLDTHNTPKERWSEIMAEHFMPWSDGVPNFRMTKLECYAQTD